MACRAPAIDHPTTLRPSIDFSDRPLTGNRPLTGTHTDDGTGAATARESDDEPDDGLASSAAELAPSDASTARLTYFDPAAPPRVLAASPAYAEMHARVGVQVQGSNLSPAEGTEAGAPNQLLCRFGDTEVAAG